MTTKAAFNAEEWATVANAPYLVGMLVIAADRGGIIRESLAIGRAYAAAREQHRDDLLEAIASTPPAMEAATAPRSAEDLRRTAPATLREAVATMVRVASDDEIDEYKRFVHSVADNVARAHREGGFLGLGGTEVSEHEQAALDEIVAILDERPPETPAE